MNGRLVPWDSEDARFCIDVYRNGSEECSSQGATSKEAALVEIDRIGKAKNFDLIELYQWIDDISEWGDPIDEYEAQDFE